MIKRGEAIKRIDEQYKICEDFYYLSANPEKDFPGVISYMEALAVAISALRPVSREQVEKVWRGEWKQDKNGQVVCSRCGAITAIGSKAALHNANEYDRFCFSCGASMTDEAVEMVMERMKELK